MSKPTKARGPVVNKAFIAREAPPRPKALAKLLHDDGSHAYPVFSFSLADRAYRGDWGWHLLDEGKALRLVMFLCEMAGTSWTKVRQQTAGGHFKHHDQQVTSLCSAARRRLRELEYDDISEDIFRFRDGARGRLWGYIRRGVFYVLWFDPNHKVYPTEPG